MDATIIFSIFFFCIKSLSVASFDFPSFCNLHYFNDGDNVAWNVPISQSAAHTLTQFLSAEKFFESAETNIKTYTGFVKTKSYKIRHSQLTCEYLILMSLATNQTLTNLQEFRFHFADHLVILQAADVLDIALITESITNLLGVPFLIYTINTSHRADYVVCVDGSIKKFQSVQKLIEKGDLVKFCTSSVYTNRAVWHPQLLHRADVEKAFESKACAANSRRSQFYSRLSNCHTGFTAGMLMAAHTLNISFHLSSQMYEDEIQQEALLTVVWQSLLHTGIQRETFSIYPPRYKITYQAKIQVLYCGKQDDVIGKNWAAYVSVFDSNIWLSLLSILVVISCVHRRISVAIRFAWLCLGYSSNQQRRKLWMYIYFISILFLSAIYSAGFSTNHMSVSSPKSLIHLHSLNFRFFHLKQFYLTLNRYITSELTDKFTKAFGVTDFGEIFSFMTHGDRRSLHSLNEFLEKVAEGKPFLSVTNTGQPLFSVTPLLAKILWLTKRVIVQNKYICGSMSMPEDVDVTIRFRYLVWGALSAKFNKKFTGLEEMGIVGQINVLIQLVNEGKDNTSWEPLSARIQTPEPICLDSPFGLACFLQASACLAIAFCTAIIQVLNFLHKHLRMHRFFQHCNKIYNNLFRRIIQFLFNCFTRFSGKI